MAVVGVKGLRKANGLTPSAAGVSSLAVGKGGIFGVLGPNGAGRTAEGAEGRCVPGSGWTARRFRRG